MLKQRRGALVTIGGTSGRKPDARFTIGSRVNCIHPSLVDTDRQRTRIAAEIERSGRSEADIRAQFCREAGIMRFGTPQDVADLVCFLVSARGSWLQGATIDLDGGEIPVL